MAITTTQNVEQNIAHVSMENKSQNLQSRLVWLSNEPNIIYKLEKKISIGHYDYNNQIIGNRNDV